MNDSEKIENLYQVILQLNNAEDCQALFEDLCTRKELANMAERGEYRMLDLEDAVYRSKEVLKVFDLHGVECIRIGLCASDNLGDLEKVKGGANHPALGELVRGEMYYDELRELLRGMDKRESLSGKRLLAYVKRGELSLAIGQRGRNRDRLKKEFSIHELVFHERDGALGITVSISD